MLIISIPKHKHRYVIRVFSGCLFALILFFLPGFLKAEQGPEIEGDQFADMSLKELMDLEVFSAATLLPTEQAKAPGTVYSFDSEDFTRLGIRRLDDLFAYIPGFQVNQYRKRHRSIWARGLLDLYNDKMVLLVDGIRRQHAYYGHFALGDNFPLEKVEKVEIILGPASSLYGTNAFGGIISVTTKGFSAQESITMTAEGGSNARGKGTVLYNSEKAQLFGSYLSQEAPFREDRKSFIGGETVQPLDEDYANLFFKVMPLEGLTVSADYYRNNTPFIFIPANQDSYIEEENLTLSASYEAGDLDRVKLQANVYFTWDNTTEFEQVNPSHELGYKEYQNSIIAGSTITGFKRLFDSHIVALGFNWMHTEAVNMDFSRYYHFSSGKLDPPISGSLLSDPNASNDDFAFYVQDVWTIIPELELTLNGRYDNFEQFGDYFNYRAALVFTPTDRQTWKIMYGTGIRAPTFREYLKVLEGTDFVPPTLNPESIASLEFGYLYQWENANLSLTLFRNEVEDYIHVKPTPDGADEFFSNSEKPWVLRGAEALLRFFVWESLDVRISAAYLDPKQQEAGKLPYLANWTSSFALNYNVYESHNLGFSLIYNSYRTDTNIFPGDDSNDFLIANLFASGQITSKLSYAFGIDNVFDSKVFDPAADFGKQHNTERTEREIWGRLTLGFDL